MIRERVPLREVVVKVQLPWAGDLSRALVYSRDRSIQLQVPVDTVAGALGGRPKAYFRGVVHPTGVLELTSETANQDW